MTALVEAAGRGRGKRLLYWFRTPPGVRVGRAPIDETAIRLLEEHNPDVEFDWTRILKAPPPDAARRPERETRDRDQRGRREARQPRGRTSADSGPRTSPRVQPPVADSTSSAPPVAVPVPDGSGLLSEAAVRALEASAGEHPPAPLELPDHISHLPPAHLDEPEPFATVEPPEPAAPFDTAEPAELPESGALPDFEPTPEDLGSPSYQRLGAEGLVRLRARYAEVMARIAERPMDEPVRDELKERAQRLNPDAWVTSDEVTAALEQYETVFEGLRGVVGRHPRGRRRGRR